MLQDTNHVPQMQVSVGHQAIVFLGEAGGYSYPQKHARSKTLFLFWRRNENAARNPFPRLSLLGVVVIVAAACTYAFGHLDEYHHVNLPKCSHRCDSLIRDEWSDWDVGSLQIRTASNRCLFQVLLNRAKQEYKEDPYGIFGSQDVPYLLP